MMNDLISRKALITEYDRVHIGPPGGARKLMKDAPTVDAVILPCEIGDMVHRKDGSWNVVGFECDRSGSWKVKLERWKDRFMDYHESTKVSFKSFGETVFLTSKEAAAAFAKKGGDGNG